MMKNMLKSFRSAGDIVVYQALPKSQHDQLKFSKNCGNISAKSMYELYIYYGRYRATINSMRIGISIFV